MKSLNDDLQSWTTFRLGRPSELEPPSELDNLQSWTTLRVGRPSESDDLLS
ncbi:hypothetical protein DPMN_120543 [Dreissena polymorpha]|uniref:Uncharacterized protein n=1 Tax=Dreissena polymorpha TaxID=45954 RepID=A0A9D4GL07_DREPO|nr:hypothetical protein DPMN_120543 [Dreissena polymorpha]